MLAEMGLIRNGISTDDFGRTPRNINYGTIIPNAQETSLERGLEYPGHPGYEFPFPQIRDFSHCLVIKKGEFSDKPLEPASPDQILYYFSSPDV
jgi:hypothetical protein